MTDDLEDTAHKLIGQMGEQKNAVGSMFRQMLERIEALETELAQLKSTYTPTHTDMMVDPETLDVWLEQNPLPED